MRQTKKTHSWQGRGSPTRRNEHAKRDKREHEEWPDPDADLWPQQCPFVAGQNKRWTPRLEIENCRRDFSRETWFKVFYKGKQVDEEGRERIIHLDWPVVEYNLVIRGMFTFEFQPHRFPFDVQELPLRVRSNRSIPSKDASSTSESVRHFAHICLDERKGHPSKVLCHCWPLMGISPCLPPSFPLSLSLLKHGNLLAGAWDRMAPYVA